MIFYFIIAIIVIVTCCIIYFRTRPDKPIRVTDIHCKKVIPLLELAKKDKHAQQLMSDFLTRIDSKEILLSEQDGDTLFPWKDVLACKGFVITRLTYKASFTSIENLNNCPTCDHELVWIYLVEKSEYYQKEGYLSLCTECVRQINFIKTGYLIIDKNPLFR